MPAGGWRGWTGPLAVAAIGAVIRFTDLGRPHAIAFDETYYPKDALALLRYGYEQQFVDNANDIILNSDGNWQTLPIFKDEAAYVVHPPFGKWVIASGEALFGATPFGWRIAVAILGVLSILMLARVVRRMTRSDLIGTIAGLLLALDGMHIVLSRTGLLDMVLSFCVLVAFALLVLDRDRVRRRLARLVDEQGLAATATEWGPRLGPRPLRWAAAIALGLACGVKWSGLWYLAFFALMTVLWDVGARRTVGVGRPWSATLLRDAPLAAITMIPIAAVTYVVTWTGWIRSTGGWGRTWAESQPASIVPDWLRSLAYYHGQAWQFHVGLTSEHSYASSAWSWFFQTRPTSFYFESIEDGSMGCTVAKCAAEVVALGNPIIWWAGTAALVYMIWLWAARRDWRAGAILAAVLAGWLPWLLYPDRTIFTFYSVVFVPYLCIALAIALGAILGGTDATPDRRRRGAMAVGAFIVVVIAVAWWMYPVWTGQVLPYDQWTLRMWMPTWV
jgi:dolichyl-phosphate-mannose--protein O-mannosyl transferase